MATLASKVQAFKTITDKANDGVKLSRKDRRAKQALTRQLKLTPEQVAALTGTTNGKPVAAR
jgi:hypothetical protein